MKSIDKVLTIAHQEIGYVEKRSNSQLDSKTGNAGSSNYTKYARDLYPSLQEIGRASCREECLRLCRSRWSPYH